MDIEIFWQAQLFLHLHKNVSSYSNQSSKVKCVQACAPEIEIHICCSEQKNAGALDPR